MRTRSSNNATANGRLMSFDCLSALKASHRSKHTTSEPGGIKTLFSAVNLEDSWRRPTAIPPLATNSYFVAHQQGGGGPDSFGLCLVLVGPSLKSGTSGILALSLPSHPPEALLINDVS
ncbi:hypothetical protein CCUS01_03776 [Colletotrichum cuscutae]|uniref:Uncharacterized protein n=1 Tax=Colletotrichum cuscutae TaxID=1209917 RepID=A0AAI9VGD9_9PEZI|nr:hypothetical protein CCUS01_03776 [Colletotrichum cuscutae]